MMFRPRLRIPTRSTGLGRVAIPRTQPQTQTPAMAAAANAARSMHTVPSLDHDFSKGVPNLMSDDGFGLAWTDYMSMCVGKLNALTVGTEFEDKDTKTIALMTAREPAQAPIFNYASMAHNTHFFFKGLHPDGTAMPPKLREDLEMSFSSIDTLRRELILTAGAMFGPGFVWLVKGQKQDFKILNTYLAGSPYSGAHWREQAVDMNSRGQDGSAAQYFQHQTKGARGSQRQEPHVSEMKPPGGIDVVPVLCLSTWEHSWLVDWGFGGGGKEGGKVAFLEAWWDKIDWEGVAQRAGSERREAYK